MIARAFILSFFLLTIAVSTAYSDIFKYVDKDGVAHYTNIPQGSRYRQILGEKRAASPGGLYHDIIQRKSSKYNVEPSLVSAVISVESNWRPDAVSSRGAMGLMQLMPGTADDMQVMNPFDPEDNIDGGVRYLSLMIDRFNDIDLALAAYNAGPGRVDRSGGLPDIKETREYVSKVLSLYGGSAGNSPSNYSSPMTQTFKVTMKKRAPVYTSTP